MGSGNEELMERIRSLELQSADLESKLQMQQHQCQTMRIERDDAIKNEREANKQIDVLETACERISQEKEELRNENNELIKDMEELKGELK